MIGETLIDLFFSIFRGLFTGFGVLDLPLGLVSILVDFLAIGNWVVGLDLMAAFVGTVVFWWGVQMSIGLAVWVWEHIPLT